MSSLTLLERTTLQSVVGSTLTNETVLKITMGASDKWICRWTLVVSDSSGLGIKVAVTTPTGATLQAFAYALEKSNITDLTAAGQTTTSGAAISLIKSTLEIVVLTASVQGDGSHSGTITLQFAEMGSGTGVAINAGSALEAILV